MATLAGFLAAAATAVSRQDGPALAALLSLSAPAPAAAVAAALAEPRPVDVAALASARLPPPFDEVLVLHCQCLAARAQGRPDEAYAAAVGALGAFTRDFRASDSAWGVRPLATLARGLRAAAADADADAAAAGRAQDRLSDAGSQLMKCFSAAHLASNPDKKRATLAIVNQAFGIYFRLNTLRLCKNMIASVEARNALPLADYPVAQRCTYRFFTGRLAVFDEQYGKADADLSYALALCPPGGPGGGGAVAARNRARILTYLLPVKLLLGQLPSAGLMAAQPGLAALYGPVAGAVRSGDVRALTASLEAHQAAFIRAGTYLLLEKLRAGCQRTLLKRVHAAARAQGGGGQGPAAAAAAAARAHQLPFALFQRALAWLGEPAEMDEVECVLANLVHRRYVRGYLSHRARVLVLSKTQPFPPLASVAHEDPA